MNTFGKHVLLEFSSCTPGTLDDLEAVKRLLFLAADAAGATIVGDLFHQFSPRGVTGMVLLAESHMTVHTWPETGYAAIDIYTCGNCQPEAAVPVLLSGLGAQGVEIMRVHRGRRDPGSKLAVMTHSVLQAPVQDLEAETLQEGA